MVHPESQHSMSIGAFPVFLKTQFCEQFDFKLHCQVFLNSFTIDRNKNNIYLFSFLFTLVSSVDVNSNMTLKQAQIFIKSFTLYGLLYLDFDPIVQRECFSDIETETFIFIKCVSFFCPMVYLIQSFMIIHGQFCE